VASAGDGETKSGGGKAWRQVGCTATQFGKGTSWLLTANACAFFRQKDAEIDADEETRMRDQLQGKKRELEVP